MEFGKGVDMRTVTGFAQPDHDILTEMDHGRQIIVGLSQNRTNKLLLELVGEMLHMAFECVSVFYLQLLV